MQTQAQLIEPVEAPVLSFSIGKEILQKVLSHVQTVVEKRNTIPILSNILIQSQDNQLKFSATDMDIAIDEYVSADIKAAGSITVPAHMLYDIVRKIPSHAEIGITFNPETQQIKLKSGRSKFTLSCLPVDDFPVISEGQFDHQFAISADDLKKLIDGTKSSMSTEETRYYLNGIYLHRNQTVGEEEMLRAVTTDGHRLARLETEIPESADQIPGVILPRKTVLEVRKLIDSYVGDIQVHLSENRVKFAFEDIVLCSKLIDGSFPDYNHVIPSDNNIKIEVDCAEFTKAVDRVSTVATETTRGVKLTFENDRLLLNANSPENGVAKEEVAIDYRGDSLMIGFNSKYLLDVAQQITGDKIIFLVDDHETPVIVKDSDDKSALYVLMPLRV